MYKSLAVLLVLLTTWCACIADPVPPRDAAFTIYCRSFTGPLKAQEAKAFKEALIAQTGMKDFRVIHGQDESTLYYGYYRSENTEAKDGDERKEALRAHADLEKLKGLRDETQAKVFPMGMVVPISSPGSEGPAEWDIQNAPKDAYWTLLIGVYRDNPAERKKAAVEAVKALREDKVDAYYYHGSTASCIMIGTWPEAAVYRENTDEVRQSREGVRTIVSNLPFSTELPREMVSKDGTPIEIKDPKVKILDPSLQKAMDRYPEFMINGEVMERLVDNPRTHLKDRVRDRSVTMRIPRRQSSAVTDNSPQSAPRNELINQLQGAPRRPAAGQRSLNRLAD